MAIKLDKSDYIQSSPDSPLETDLVTKMFHNLRVDIVEKQDALIMKAIRLIGGDRYQQITIDKSKVIDALGKSVPKKPLSEDYNSQAMSDVKNYICPTCHKLIFVINPWMLKYALPKSKYCADCGQAFDWGDQMEEVLTDEKEI